MGSFVVKTIGNGKLPARSPVGVSKRYSHFSEHTAFWHFGDGRVKPGADRLNAPGMDITSIINAVPDAIIRGLLIPDGYL
jgi:hypothetical protein